MRASATLISHIKRFESCRLTAYQDTAGVWTVGYVHTKGVKKGDRITQYQAEQFLREDLSEFERAANKVRRLTTQGRYDAVLDFMYNLGIGNFNKSTLKNVISKYFNNSYLGLVSSLVKEEQISIDELKELINEVEKANKS